MSMLNLAYLPLLTHSLIAPNESILTISSALYFLNLTFESYKSPNFLRILCESLVSKNMNKNIHDYINQKVISDLDLFLCSGAKYNFFKFNHSNDFNLYMMSNYDHYKNYNQLLNKITLVD